MKHQIYQRSACYFTVAREIWIIKSQLISGDLIKVYFEIEYEVQFIM